MGYFDVIFVWLMVLYFKVIDLLLDWMYCIFVVLGYLECYILLVIYIVGINGKGLMQVMICVGFEVQGKCVYVYILLYLVWFYECIWLVGMLIFEFLLVQIFEECEVVNVGQFIIFFEIIMVVVFLVFLCSFVDYILFEVGLGGWLDVMNVVDVLCLIVIMFVSIDYM